MPKKMLEKETEDKTTEWGYQPKGQIVNVVEWISSNKTKLEKEVSQQTAFVKACGQANVGATKKFNELLSNFLNPPDLYWEEFRETFTQSVQKQLQRFANAKDDQDRILENALFSSFTRLVDLPSKPRLA